MNKAGADGPGIKFKQAGRQDPDLRGKGGRLLLHPTVMTSMGAHIHAVDTSGAPFSPLQCPAQYRPLAVG